MIWTAISWYSAMNGRITASDYADILSNQVNPMDQMLLPNNDAIFQDDSSPTHTHTARSVQSCLRSMKMHFNIFPDQHNSQT